MKLPMNEAQAVRELRAAGMEGSNQDLIEYYHFKCDEYIDECRDEGRFKFSWERDE